MGAPSARGAASRRPACTCCSASSGCLCSPRTRTASTPPAWATIASFPDGHLVLGATGGYLIGFVLAAGVVGRLAELGWDRRLRGSIAAMLIGRSPSMPSALPWLAVAAHLSVSDTLLYGLYPFLPGRPRQAAPRGRAAARRLAPGRRAAIDTTCYAARDRAAATSILTDAIVTDGPVQDLRRRPRAPGQPRHRGARSAATSTITVHGRRDLRLPGPERRGQEHHHPHPARLPARQRRRAPRVLGRDVAADGLAIRDRVGYLPGGIALYDSMTRRGPARLPGRPVRSRPRPLRAELVDRLELSRGGPAPARCATTRAACARRWASSRPSSTTRSWRSSTSPPRASTR